MITKRIALIKSKQTQMLESCVEILSHNCSIVPENYPETFQDNYFGSWEHWGMFKLSNKL